MTTPATGKPESRAPLSRERVFETAVAYADEHGIEELSMRKLGQELGVEAMSLYYHVSNKDEILDGMVDHVVAQIEIQPMDDDWKFGVRRQIMAARQVMARHRWAIGVLETRRTMSPAIMRYFDTVGGLFRQAGFSVELMHHAMHALGSRVLGFSQELFDVSGDDQPRMDEAVVRHLREGYPNIAAIVEEVQHQEATIVGSGCDDDVEFRFALDILLDGLERHRDLELERAG
jgi:AcrR family transcriptional regulator